MRRACAGESKWARRPKPETAATRLVWAAGYFVDEDYYVDELKVEGLPKLHRGQQYVSADGMVRGARLERKSQRRQETWESGAGLTIRSSAPGNLTACE